MSVWASRLPRLRELIADGASVQTMAETFNTTAGNIYKVCHRNGIAIPRPKSYRQDLNRMADTLRRAGYTVTPPEE